MIVVVVSPDTQATNAAVAAAVTAAVTAAVAAAGAAAPSTERGCHAVARHGHCQTALHGGSQWVAQADGERWCGVIVVGVAVVVVEGVVVVVVVVGVVVAGVDVDFVDVDFVDVGMLHVRVAAVVHEQIDNNHVQGFVDWKLHCCCCCCSVVC